MSVGAEAPNSPYLGAPQPHGVGLAGLSRGLRMNYAIDGLQVQTLLKTGVKKPAGLGRA